MEAYAGVAARQHALITTKQVLESGISHRALARLVRTGRLEVRYRGVFAVGGSPRTWHQEVMAAVLATDGVVACCTAAVMLGIIDKKVLLVDVIAPVRRRPRAGVRLHQAQLTRTDVRTIEGIPTTAPNRTLVDLAGELTTNQLEDALDKAVFQGLTSLRALDRYIATRKLEHKRGVATLRALIADRGKGMTQSELERVFLRKLRKTNLPEPVRQFAVGRYKIDMGYPEHNVVIELDGHGTRYARRQLQQHDRRQNAVVLALPGWTLLRFSRDDVLNDWPYVEATLRKTLA